MSGWRRWSATALLGTSLCVSAWAAPATSVEMLRDMFRLPVTEWRQTLKANNRLLNEEFFSNIDKRIRWGIENNHIDDAFRFAMVGDFASEAGNRPANYRIDMAELFMKAQNYVMSGQIVDNIIITSPGTPPALRARFLHGQLKELQKDLFGAYQDFISLAEERYLPDQTWYRAGLISLYIGQEARAKEELAKAATAGSNEAAAELERLRVIAEGGWDTIAPMPNSTNDNTLPNTATSPNVPPTFTVTEPAVQQPEDPLAKARLARADNRLDDALTLYAAIYEPQNAEMAREYGAILYRTGDLAKAMGVFDKAIEANPEDAELLRCRANTYERMYDRQGKTSDLKAALVDYKAASALAPGHQLISWELNRAESKN